MSMLAWSPGPVLLKLRGGGGVGGGETDTARVLARPRKPGVNVIWFREAVAYSLSCLNERNQTSRIRHRKIRRVYGMVSTVTAD